MKIKDSGNRRQFDTGAVRDIADGKGRCDLLPLVTIGEIMDDEILVFIGNFIYTGNKCSIVSAIGKFINLYFESTCSAILDVAKHYEDGANKYAERNWEQGIPLHCYVDSGIRHYLKFIDDQRDEPHDRAFLWNMLCLLWTMENKPPLIDLPFVEVEGCDPMNT